MMSASEIVLPSVIVSKEEAQAYLLARKAAHSKLSELDEQLCAISLAGIFEKFPKLTAFYFEHRLTYDGESSSQQTLVVSNRGVSRDPEPDEYEDDEDDDASLLDAELDGANAEDSYALHEALGDWSRRLPQPMASRLEEAVIRRPEGELAMGLAGQTLRPEAFALWQARALEAHTASESATAPKKGPSSI